MLLLQDLLLPLQTLDLHPVRQSSESSQFSNVLTRTNRYQVNTHLLLDLLPSGLVPELTVNLPNLLTVNNRNLNTEHLNKPPNTVLLPSSNPNTVNLSNPLTVQLPLALKLEEQVEILPLAILKSFSNCYVRP